MSETTTPMAFTGERFVPGEQGNIELEHLHRYLVAANLVAGKVVLDIACGEGYGSDMMAAKAHRVIGVDLSAEAVEHAQLRYTRDNLQFKHGDCANIPLPDHSIDVIVSFETIEHHDQHEESFREFKRVLKPDGSLLISSPDRKYYSDSRNFVNKYHVKELYEHEFQCLVTRHFRTARFYSQRIVFGSLLFPLSSAAPARSYIYTNKEIATAPGVYEPLYLLALASDGEIGSLEASVLEQPINDAEIIRSWEQVMAERDAEVDHLRLQVKISEEALQNKQHENQDLLQRLSHSDRKMEVERQNLTEEVGVLRRINSELTFQNQRISDSKSWKITAPLREFNRRVHRFLPKMLGISGGHDVSPQAGIKNALRYLIRGDFRGLIDRVRSYRRQAQAMEVHRKLGRTGTVWGILTTPHTVFIAHCISERLAAHGIASEVLTSPPAVFSHDFYVVLCAQMFDRLPPGEKRVLFQLEQSVSSRWFTNDYLAALEESVAVLDYSLVNIEFLIEKGIAYPHVFYLPIGTSINRPNVIAPSEKKYDFLFYGDYYSSPRREKMLEVLKQHFNVKLCNDAFGEEMHALIRKARAVVNIHYYENALLEMPRIQECLSQGVPVISEEAQDQDDYPELRGAVQFFKQNSTEDMLRACREFLESSEGTTRRVAQSVETSGRRFTFMLDRFLVAIGVLPANLALKKAIYLPAEKRQIALSMPETIKRRRMFVSEKPDNCALFDGIRNVRGWIGCGSSYSALARRARAANAKDLIVFEDDVLFREDHAARMETIEKYLEATDHWDIFSGMIASAHPNTKVFGVEERDGMTFVKLDRMTSMVFNIYNRRAIRLLSDWDPNNTDVDTNAVDRYLENQEDLRVVVTLPFLVGHREDVSSTLWGFQNDRYSSMIIEAEEAIRALADHWLAEQGRESAISVHQETSAL